MIQKKTSYAFLWISRLPRGLETSSWTFFNSPFRVDFKNVHFYIIWWNLDWDIGKILQGHHFKSILFCLIMNEALEHSKAPMSTSEHSLALSSTYRQWWALKSMMPWHHQCYRVLMRAYWVSWVLKCLIQNYKIDLKWCPVSILPISQSRFYQII